MKAFCLSLLVAASLLSAELKSGPPLPLKPVVNWAKLPKGWNFGECSGVAVDKEDNVWVFNRGPHPVMQFDRDGIFLQSWGEGTIVSAHGIRIDADGNVWGIDVKGHRILKYDRAGRILMVMGRSPGTNDSQRDFNEPTNIAFHSNGDFFISDGYVNARVIKFDHNGEYLTHWGHKGTGDSEFNLVHDVVLDRANRVYVADRLNERIQIFDDKGKFLAKWTGIGAPWGLDYSPKDSTIYMADGVNNRVIQLNLDGEILGVLGSYGHVPGKFDYAHSIAVDSTGAVYVAEIRNWRVQKFVRR